MASKSLLAGQSPAQIPKETGPLRERRKPDPPRFGSAKGEPLSVTFLINHMRQDQATLLPPGSRKGRKVKAKAPGNKWTASLSYLRGEGVRETVLEHKRRLEGF